MYWSSSCVFVVSHCHIHLVGSLTLSLKVHVFSYKVTNTQCRAVAELQLKEFVCLSQEMCQLLERPAALNVPV